ncbi:hypothetical protein HMPREF0762_01668 [Slackia exigua ATCC 700122]|uniref:Uncharacterized protein n=1 Tax=Slackia exigua (strain ATCC 700122 / DSM 15923 / CIP 105133 / JCM 11022 / KCTC 5966 / S-7) TaxID=649764 RepID=D0WIJ2_SLAES|nr:hypothetical protein HMPREF0762_01668 [Slackia exigua ATCC 700122]
MRRICTNLGINGAYGYSPAQCMAALPMPIEHAHYARFAHIVLFSRAIRFSYDSIRTR